MPAAARPPRLSRALLGLVLPSRIRDHQVGDLDDEFRLRVANATARVRRAQAAKQARRWYRRQVLGSLAPAVACRIRELEPGATFRRVGKTAALDLVAQDVRFALRSLRNRPVFTSVAIVTLALGVGANTAIFSLVNAVLLQPLAVADADRLLAVWEEDFGRELYGGMVAPANFFDWRARVGAFDDAAAYGGGVVTVAGEGLPGSSAESVAGAWVTGNFFGVLGVRAAHGRVFRDEETWNDTPPVVMLSDRLWARRFGRDPAVVGSSILIDEVPREVVGIVPAGLDFPDPDVEVWQPLAWERTAPGRAWFRDERFLRVVARLQAGATPEQARAQLHAVAAQLRREHPDANRGMDADLTSLHDFLRGDAQRPLLVLLGATALLLLLTCANVANLLLVRASARHREVRLRAALGAGRGRIVRQMLTETLVLALLGGVAGVAAGSIGSRVLIAWQPTGAWRADAPALDAPVLLFAFGITLASAVLFGVAPAIRSAGVSAAAGLREGARASIGRRSRRLGEALVVAEVALALVLLIGAGLLLRSFVALRSVDPGFRVDDRAVASVVLPARYANDGAVLAFIDELTARLDRLPGVSAVTYASRVPLRGTTVNPDGLSIEGGGPIESRTQVGSRLVAPSYFRVLGVPLLAGRSFESTDVATSEPVVILNAQAARRLFPNDDPIGRRITWDRVADPDAQWFRIVGIVGDEHQNGLHAPAQMEAYLPFRRIPSRRIQFVVHVSARPAATAGELVRTELAAVDPLVPLSSFTTLPEMYATALGPDRFVFGLIGTFGTLALVLATVGVYGVLSEVTRRRTREIGIRIALGATAADLARMVLRQGAAPATAGIAVGLLGALGAVRLMAGLLFDVAPLDPLTFAIAPLALAVAAALACAIPTLRAVRLDARTALDGD